MTLKDNAGFWKKKYQIEDEILELEERHKTELETWKARYCALVEEMIDLREKQA